jgi:hypothetical protein
LDQEGQHLGGLGGFNRRPGTRTTILGSPWSRAGRGGLRDGLAPLFQKGWSKGCPFCCQELRMQESCVPNFKLLLLFEADRATIAPPPEAQHLLGSR